VEALVDGHGLPKVKIKQSKMIETTICNTNVALIHATAFLALCVKLLAVTDMNKKMMRAQATAYFACINVGSELISADRIKVTECILPVCLLFHQQSNKKLRRV